MELKTDKRIVSWDKYVKPFLNSLLGVTEASQVENTETDIAPTRTVTLAEYTALAARKIAAGLLAVLVGLMSIHCVALAFKYWPLRENNPGWAAGAFFCALSAACFLFCLYMKCKDAACKADPVVLLTRANTADLSAPDSLVRASSEPLQAREAVLLRAAAEGMETPPGQLVRASVRLEAIGTSLQELHTNDFNERRTGDWEAVPERTVSQQEIHSSPG